jgi:hypothetical protein
LRLRAATEPAAGADGLGAHGLAAAPLGILRLADVLTLNVKIEEWRFRPEKIGANRLRLLQQEVSFSSIARRISNEMTNVTFHPKEGRREAKNKVRAEFFFDVCGETWDIFFNSSQGHRAQYYLDPKNGIECNRFVIDMLRNKFIQAAMESSQDVMTLEQVKRSLDYGSAKIWICEENSTLDQTSRDPEQIVALAIPRWVDAMKRVLAAWAAQQQPSPSIQTRALLGVQAPEGSRIEVLGTWLDDSDQEFVPPSKIHRALHIHQYGFS